MSESLTLKWGALKGWSLKTDASHAAFKKYAELGLSMSAITQHDTPEQQAALLELIDVVDCDVITLEWEGKDVSKDVSKNEAKDYVRNYATS